MSDIPFWIDMTPETIKRGRWEQKVMAWLIRTQSKERASLIILGYLYGRRDIFEIADKRMRSEAATAPANRRSWRQLGSCAKGASS
jgi:hypothetical protein